MIYHDNDVEKCKKIYKLSENTSFNNGLATIFKRIYGRRDFVLR